MTMTSLFVTALVTSQPSPTSLSLKSWNVQVTSSGKVRSLRWLDANGGKLDIFVPDSAPGDRRALVNFSLIMDDASQGYAEYWIDGKKFASRFAAKHDIKDSSAIRNDPGTGFFKVNAVDAAKNTVDVEFQVELTEFNPHYSKQGKGRTFTLSWRLNGMRSSSLSPSPGEGPSGGAGTTGGPSQPSAAYSAPYQQVPRLGGGTNPNPEGKPPLNPSTPNAGGATNTTPGTNPSQPPAGPDLEKRRTEAKQQAERVLAELDRNAKSFENAVGTIVGIANLRAQRNEITRGFRRQLDEIPATLPSAHRAALGRVIAAKRDYTIALAEQSFAESELKKAQDELSALPANDGRRMYFQGVVAQRQVELSSKQREARSSRDSIRSAEGALSRTLDALDGYVSPRESTPVDPAGGKVLEQVPLEVDEAREFLKSLGIGGPGRSFSEFELSPYTANFYESTPELDHSVKQLASHYSTSENDALKASFRRSGRQVRLMLRRTGTASDLPGRTLEGTMEIRFELSQLKRITSDINSRYPNIGTLTVFLEAAQGEPPITVSGSRSDVRLAESRRTRGSGRELAYEIAEARQSPVSLRKLEVQLETADDEAAVLGPPFSAEFNGPLMNRVAALLAAFCDDGRASTLEEPVASLQLTRKPVRSPSYSSDITEYGVAYPFQRLVPENLLSEYEALRAIRLGDERVIQGSFGLALLLYGEGARLFPDLAGPRMYAVSNGYRDLYLPSLPAKDSDRLQGQLIQHHSRSSNSLDEKAGGIRVAYDDDDFGKGPAAVMRGEWDNGNIQNPLKLRDFHSFQLGEVWTVKEFTWMQNRTRRAFDALDKMLSQGADAIQGGADIFESPEAAGAFAFMYGWELWEGGQANKAVSSFELALDLGFDGALSPLGLAAMLGKGVAQNEALAISLWTKGAELGIRDCQRLLGVTRALGTKSSQPNAEEAKALWTEASRPGLCLFGRMQDKQAKAFLEGATPDYELLRLPHFWLGEAPVHHSQVAMAAMATPASKNEQVAAPADDASASLSGARQPEAKTPAEAPIAGSGITGRPIGEYRMVDLQGRAITQETLKGQVVVMYFFATWCHPSQDCAKAMVQLNRELGGGRVTVIGANVFEQYGTKTSEKDKRLISLSNTLKFREKISANPMQIFTTFNDELAKRWSINATPTILLLDRGSLVRRWDGLSRDGADLAELKARVKLLSKDRG